MAGGAGVGCFVEGPRERVSRSSTKFRYLVFKFFGWYNIETGGWGEGRTRAMKRRDMTSTVVGPLRINTQFSKLPQFIQRKTATRFPSLPRHGWSNGSYALL